ncbi:hypothetical protein HK101_003745 [Irineochytrium annulatum]|nr:hypothetical protein HK101_003745 [Irineochytrium annulatum]
MLSRAEVGVDGVKPTGARTSLVAAWNDEAEVSPPWPRLAGVAALEMEDEGGIAVFQMPADGGLVVQGFGMNGEERDGGEGEEGGEDESDVRKWMVEAEQGVVDEELDGTDVLMRDSMVDFGPVFDYLSKKLFEEPPGPIVEPMMETVDSGGENYELGWAAEIREHDTRASEADLRNPTLHDLWTYKHLSKPIQYDATSKPPRPILPTLDPITALLDSTSLSSLLQSLNRDRPHSFTRCDLPSTTPNDSVDAGPLSLDHLRASLAAARPLEPPLDRQRDLIRDAADETRRQRRQEERGNNDGLFSVRPVIPVRRRPPNVIGALRGQRKSKEFIDNSDEEAGDAILAEDNEEREGQSKKRKRGSTSGAGTSESMRLKPWLLSLDPWWETTWRADPDREAEFAATLPAQRAHAVERAAREVALARVAVVRPANVEETADGAINVRFETERRGRRFSQPPAARTPYKKVVPERFLDWGEVGEKGGRRSSRSRSRSKSVGRGKVEPEEERGRRRRSRSVSRGYVGNGAGDDDDDDAERNTPVRRRGRRPRSMSVATTASSDGGVKAEGIGTTSAATTDDGQSDSDQEALESPFAPPPGRLPALTLHHPLARAPIALSTDAVRLRDRWLRQDFYYGGQALPRNAGPSLVSDGFGASQMQLSQSQSASTPGAWSVDVEERMMAAERRREERERGARSVSVSATSRARTPGVAEAGRERGSSAPAISSAPMDMEAGALGWSQATDGSFMGGSQPLFGEEGEKKPKKKKRRAGF